MKNISLFFAGIMLLFAACEPVEDAAPDLGALPTGNFVVDSSDPNNVKFTVTENTGFLANWDFGNSQKSQAAETTIYYPFANDYTVSLTVSGQGGSSVIYKTVNVPTSDPLIANDTKLAMLTGGVSATNGKTWVYDTDNATYFYMTADYDWEEYWWSPIHDDGEALAGIANEMTFDINGAFNYSIKENATATATQAGFVFDSNTMTLTVVGATIPDYDNENFSAATIPTGVYVVKELTDDTLILWQIQAGNGYAWAWRFKVK